MQLEHVLYVSWGDNGGYSIGNVFLSPDDPKKRYYEILPERIPEDFKEAFLSACSKQNAVPSALGVLDAPITIVWGHDYRKVIGRAETDLDTGESTFILDSNALPPGFKRAILGDADVYSINIFNSEKETNVCNCEETNHFGSPCGGSKCHCHEDETPPMELPEVEKTYFSITFDSVNVADVNDIVTAARQAAGWPKSYGTYCAPITEDD